MTRPAPTSSAPPPSPPSPPPLHPSPPSSPQTFPRLRILLVLLAVLHAAVALLAARGNASTFDEPVHIAAALRVLQGDYSVNPEHPPAWKYIAALAAQPSRPSLSTPVPDEILTDPTAQWAWAVRQLYLSGDPDLGERLVGAARWGMVAFGAALVLVGAALAGRLAGPRAALLAGLLLALDPLLLAHSPIVSDDVPVTLLILSAVWAGLALRARPTWPGALGLGVLLALAVTCKFTGALAWPLAAGLVLTRRDRFPRRLGTVLVAGLVGWAGIWAVYAFRYAPSPTGKLIDTQATALRVEQMRRLAAGQNPPLSPALSPALSTSPDTVTRSILAIEHARILPQSFTAGLLMTYAVTRGNPAYAAGLYSTSGWWWYFPFAALVKTPLPLLAIWATGLWLLARHRAAAAMPVVVVAALLWLVTMASPLNIGLRHAMPALALLSVLAAAGFAQALPRYRRVLLGLLSLLALAAAAAYPHYLACFNIAGRSIGPTRLLADSNLDWGQDLARLGTWRKAHPEGRLYLAYWGTAHPLAYALDATHLPRTYDFATQSPPGPEPGYVAVSVTYLQGLTNAGEPAPFYARLLTQEPVARIGKSILVWRYNPR